MISKINMLNRYLEALSIISLKLEKLIEFLILTGIIVIFPSCQSANSNKIMTVINEKDANFQIALTTGDVEDVIFFLKEDIPLNNPDLYDETPIFTAARYGHTDLIALLLLKGADSEVINVFGERPIHIAAANGNIDSAALLAAHSGGESLQDGFNLTPIQRALENGFSFIPSRIPTMKKIYQNIEQFREDLLLASRYFSYQSIIVEDRSVNEGWTDYIARSTRDRMEGWLALDDKEFPPEIEEPITPTPIFLKQNKWESNKEFEQRVYDSQVERQNVINELQKKFKLQVEERNIKVESLLHIQQKRVSKLADCRRDFLLFSINELFTQVSFHDVTFDNQNGSLFFNHVFFGNDIIGSFVISNADKELRQLAFSNPDSLELTIEPFADEFGGFGIKQIEIISSGNSYTALPSSETIKEQELLAATIDSSVSYSTPQMQNLAFIDQNAIGEITYNDGSKALTGFDNELDNRIVKLPGVPENNQKWAIVIGAENYLNTDNIIYAKRSAELFALVAQKALGVPESHLVTLYNEEATGGNIKSKLKKVLEEGIAEGDTVFFYYNGHGVPNPSQGQSPYILPTDMDIDYISEEPFFDLRNVYTLFQESKAGEVLIFMDSCFTGKTDGKSVYQGKAAPRLAPRQIDIPNQSNIAILTAGSNTQFSSAWPEKGHRLFSYYLIDALASGVSSMDALFDETSHNVSRTSRDIGGALSFQDPTLQGNGELTW